MSEASEVRYVCYKCGTTFSEPYTYCPVCGSLLITEYTIKPRFNKNSNGLSRYIDFLPLSKIEITLGEGGTPLIELNKLAKELGNAVIYVKDESRNPTGSFVDRGVAVFVNYFRDSKKFVCATTGDTGVSLAAYSTKINADVEIYAPAGTSKQKIFQMALFGANVYVVESYSKAKNLSMLRLSDAILFSEESPLYIEGVKTIALEIYEALGNVDALIAPFGSGALLLALWKGFKELLDFGYIDTMPRLYGARLLNHKTPIVATDLFLRVPNLQRVVEGKIGDTGGKVLNVNHGMIKKYTMFLIREEGLLIDPAGVVSIAGLFKIRDRLRRLNNVVAILTGSGLKTIDEIESLVTIGDIRNIQIERERNIIFGGRIGKTKIEILKLLKESPMYGYQIKLKLKEKGINLAFSTLYQHLKELTSTGLVIRIPKWNNGRRIVVYRLSEYGERILRNLS